MIFQPVLYVIGYLLSALSIIFCIPAGVDAYYGDNQWQAFTFSSLISLFFGIILILANKSDNFNMSIKQTFACEEKCACKKSCAVAVASIIMEFLPVQNVFFDFKNVGIICNSGDPRSLSPLVRNL